MSKNYADRDIVALDKAGDYYVRHVSAMTAEDLHSKSDIAAELGHRDMVIDRLKARADMAKRLAETARELCKTLPHNDTLRYFHAKNEVVEMRELLAEWDALEGE